MPKNKTHSGAKKRFRTTGSGKIMREQAGARHLLEHKSSRKTPPPGHPTRSWRPPTSSASSVCWASELELEENSRK